MLYSPVIDDCAEVKWLPFCVRQYLSSFITQKIYSYINRALVQPSLNPNFLNNCSRIYEGVHRENGWQDIDRSMVHDAIEDVEGEFERYPACSVPTFPARVRFRLRNTYWHWGAAIQGVSIRTGLDKCPVYMAIKLLWLKPDKHYVTRNGSHLTSAQSYITGLYSIKYCPLHIINS